MKFLKHVFLITLLSFLTFSCGRNDVDSSTTNEDLAQKQNETENRITPVSELNSGIRIDGALSKTGTPPSPTGNLNFQISTEKQEAFQEYGFNIKFSTTDEIAGAYILFQDTDGNLLDNYLDVPLSALESGKSSNTKTPMVSKKSSKKQNLLTGDDYIVDVDFDSILPGNFCYDICLYDANGNISVIQNVCVEVEAWGGNFEIIGEWIYDSSNDDNTYTEDISCANGDTVTANFNDDEETWTLVLNANGSYYETYIGIENVIDYEATLNSCTLISSKENYEDKYLGNWAYNEDKETFTIIDFRYENILDASEIENYPDGSVYFNGIDTTAKIISDNLVIIETYSEFNETYTNTYTFKRK